MKKKLLILLLVLWGCIVSSAFAYTYPSQPVAAPSYQFKSTSTCPSTVGQSAFVTTTVYEPCCSSPYRSGKPRRSAWDDPDEDDPYQQGVGNVYTPIGEPFILLLMAILYALARGTFSYFSEKNLAYIKKKQ